jgi:hypothetical protein
LIIPPKAALTFGSAFHKAIEHNYKQKIKSKKDLKLKEIKEAFASAFDDGAKKTNWDGDDPDKLKDHGILCISCYHDDKIAIEHDCRAIAPTINPIACEQEFDFPLTGSNRTMKGYIDLVDDKTEDGIEINGQIVKGLIIRDTKTAARKPDANSTFKNFQLTSYFWAWLQIDGELPAGVCLDHVVKTKKPQIITLFDTRTAADIKAFEKMVDKVEQAIDYGLFFPNPNNFMCSEDQCGYWPKCQAGRKFVGDKVAFTPEF